MLILKRRRGESVQIGPATVEIIETSDGWVRLGITAPPDWDIDRADPASPKVTEKVGATTFLSA